MAEGRARTPYKLGNFDSHLISALSIKKVDILPGEDRPLRILVDMSHTAGVFQVEYVLGKKIRETALRNMVEVVMNIESVGRKVMYF